MPRREPLTRRLTATERLRATISLSPAALVRLGLPENAWAVWDTRCGPWFRQAHGCPRLPGDAERLERESAPAATLPLPPGV